MPAICSRHSLSNSTSWLHNALQVEQSCFVLHRKFATEPDGLPVGVQAVARFGQEAILLSFAAQVEQARPWIHRLPTAAAGLG
jgi:hypothetical protein